MAGKGEARNGTALWGKVRQAKVCYGKARRGTSMTKPLPPKLKLIDRRNKYVLGGGDAALFRKTKCRQAKASDIDPKYFSGRIWKTLVMVRCG